MSYPMEKLVFMILLFSGAAVANGLKFGNFRVSRSTPQGFYCEPITFPSAFTGSGRVKVYLSVSHGPVSSRVHDVTFTWVESITNGGFTGCITESGPGPLENATVNWVAHQGTEPSVAEGQVRFSDWTTGSQCSTVRFPQVYSKQPKIFVSVKHSVLRRKQDAASVWLEGISRNQFTVCLRESRSFDGRHKNIEVEWMAFETLPSSWDSVQEVKSVYFPNSVAPREADNDAFCQTVNFTNPFYSPPSILLAATHQYDVSNVNSIAPECNAISAWAEEVTTDHVTVCIKDLVGLASKHHPVTVDYMLAGDLDPCINKSCDYFAICRAFSPTDARCVCIPHCPSYEDLVCATNGQTFDNICIMKKEICRIMGNFTYYHPGSCQGFPLDKGRQDLRQDPSWSDSHCELISLKPYTFYPHKTIHIQMTVNYFNSSHSPRVHDASVIWTEQVSTNNFTMCVSKTGRNDYVYPASDQFASIDWMAYQGAPQGAVSGREFFSQWWTGTTCTAVSLPRGKFSSRPTILVTLEHRLISLKHDAASYWVEDVTMTSFQLCIRELQSYDGIHEDIMANWLAFDSLHRPLFSEHGSIYFPNNHQPLKSDNYAFCKVVNMSRDYSHIPTVLVTPTHQTGGSNSNPQSNGVTAWIEEKSATSFRVCLKELYTTRFDPVTVNYAVLSDICGDNWNYFNGYCYQTTSTCNIWQRANAKCLDQGSNLTSIHSKEENVFIQHRHGGDSGWIGLQAIVTKGNFTWTDKTEMDYTAWAPFQPNGFHNDQDCVHALGIRYKYKWNDVSCSSCHGYTCKKDYDECVEKMDDCDPISQCVNLEGGFRCQCPSGYTVNGSKCYDIDECTTGNNSCDVMATCTNTVGSYTCRCNTGYTGDGTTCTDINECTTGAHRCSRDAQCINNGGSYSCRCNVGHHGNGFTCSDVNECGGSHGCHGNAQCTNTPGSYFCTCNRGYTGNGKQCQDINECTGSPCHRLAQCTNTQGSYRCTCRSGYTGNGKQCTNIRLTHGSYGRVEVYYSGRWGTVCDDGWDINDGHAVCRMAGYNRATSVSTNAAYGQGSGPIWFRHFGCGGSESSIFSCPYSVIYTPSTGSQCCCGHHEDAGVVCA